MPWLLRLSTAEVCDVDDDEGRRAIALSRLALGFTDAVADSVWIDSLRRGWERPVLVDVAVGCWAGGMACEDDDEEAAAGWEGDWGALPLFSPLEGALPMAHLNRRAEMEWR